jgi:hypothetical protein
MHYVIEFLYTDNNQLYQTDVEMTPEESVRVEEFLKKLQNAGEIEPEGGGGAMVYEYVAPRPITFAELKKDWAWSNDSNGIGGIAKDRKIKL